MEQFGVDAAAESEDGSSRSGEREEARTEAAAPDGSEEPTDGDHPIAADDAERAELPESGPLSPPETTHDQRVRLAELLEAVEDAERVLVLTHDNPDPDALASAAGLSYLLDRVTSLHTEVAFGGIVGRAENRALIQELGVKFRRADALDEPPSTLIALVDTQPRTGNNSLPQGRIASVVMDHHPLRPETAVCSFADVRPDYGASCTLVVEYLRAAGVEPERRLATALFYGIQSETMDLGREACPADVAASLYLYPRSDPSSISRIRHARVPTGYFQSLHEALEQARRYGSVVLVPLGRLSYPDMVAEVADLFLQVEGVEWTVALGRYQEQLLLSLRTYNVSAHAGGLVRQVIGARGTAGGHGTLAGGQLSLKSMSEEQIDALREEILGDLLLALGVADEAPEPLIPGP